MKKYLVLLIVLLIAEFSFCQTLGNSFDCQIKPGYQGFTKNEIISFINHSSLENFRLQDRQTTLSFDNNFSIVLLSARELLESGLISDINSYKAAFPPNFVLPKFHLTSTGQIATEYPISKNTKFSTGRK